MQEILSEKGLKSLIEIIMKYPQSQVDAARQIQPMYSYE